jgi:toxin-antitoxin system PIN domain toxin
MILVDANILLYAEDRQNPSHEAARNWWDAQLSGSSPVGLCWEVICSFIRIGTNPHVFENPLSLPQAVSRVRSWLEQPCVRIIKPTDRHWEAFNEMLSGGQAAANLVMDAHLAALAMEHGCVLVSTDRDFSRFPKLKWDNPLV